MLIFSVGRCLGFLVVKFGDLFLFKTWGLLMVILMEEEAAANYKWWRQLIC